MAREYAKINVDLWSDDTFRDLPQASQLLYLQLLTSPSLSYAGVADWRPGRIAKLGSSWTAADVRAAAQPLREALFIVIDEDTEEVLVRSFLRHDGILSQPRLAVSMAKAHAAIASPVLRSVLVHELRRLREEQPDLKGWQHTSGKDGQALALLGLRATDPTSLPVLTSTATGLSSGSASPALEGELAPPFAGEVRGEFGGPFAPNAEESLPPVSGVTSPAPSPAPAPATPTSSLRSEVGPRASSADEPPLPRCATHATVLDAPPCRDCRDARLAAEAWEATNRARRDGAAAPCPEHPTHSSRNCPRCAQEADAARQQAQIAGWGSWRDRFAAIAEDDARDTTEQARALTVVAS